MSPTALLRRIACMDRAELRFRLSSAGRATIGRVRHRLAPPRWRRTDLAAVFDAGAVRGLVEALRKRDVWAAERALAAHFKTRSSCWPLRAIDRSRLRAAVTEAFPDAFSGVDGANRILDGRYDLLGYRGLEFGAPPDWHLDPVHGRRAPAGFWASVRYLDPECGDHKITWELNRHQHWLSLGRACWLTGDRRYRDVCLAQLRHWLSTNPPLEGVNWASMLELAFRAISWTYAVEFFAGGGDPDDEEPWLVDLLIALDRQLIHIEQNLSHYFSPNTHLTGEALALYAVSRAFPELRASARRARIGRDILLAEASRQIRVDGGHAELSAHYHRYSTDFYLLATMVARAARDPVASRFEAAARVQAEYLRTIADDRGSLPLIGDDDGGQLFAFGLTRPADAAPTLAAAADILDDAALATTAATPEDTFWILGRGPRLSIRRAHSHPWPSRWLRESGYFVSRANGGHLVFDAGPHGYLTGGHAHADALQVTLNVGDHPVLVDPGTATYTMDPEARDRFRSPRMHNTVVIDGREHARPGGPFHWDVQVDARFTAVAVGTAFDFVQGTHDADVPLRHVRSVAALEGFGWLIVDQVLGAGEHEIEAWWHLHPDLAARLSHDRQGVRLESSAQAVTLVASGGETAILADHPLALYSPEYGCIQPALAVRTCRRATAPFALATFVALPRFAESDVTIREVALNGAPPEGFSGCAFDVSIGADRLIALVAAPADGQARPWPAASAWGTAHVLSRARFGVVHARGASMATIAGVDGTVTTDGAATRPGMASAVHG